MNGEPMNQMNEALCRWCGKRVLHKAWGWTHKSTGARQCELFAAPTGAWGGRL